MNILVSRTFEVVTHESAADGDFADSGFDFQCEPFSFRDLVDLMREHPSPSEYPCTHADPHVWFSSYPEEDYSTGDETTYSIHFCRENDPRLAKYWDKAFKLSR